MKRVATGLLVVMAALFMLTRLYADVHPGMAYAKAFAEAAMVGGLADWFAVTALFRHPMGLPIPHTAIIPQNKDRIGDTLAQFLKTNFLTPAVVARRMRRVDIAGAVGRFLADPDHGGTGRLRGGASRLLASVFEALDDERLGQMAKGAVVERLRALDIAPLAGQAIAAAMREERHVPLLTATLMRISALVDANETLIRAMVHERSNSLLRWTGLDQNIADKIIDALDRLLTELAADPAHPLREKVNAMLLDLADRLEHDPVLQAKANRLKDDMIANPALQKWIGGLWSQGREALLKAARDPDRAMAGRLGDALRQLGSTLQQDERLKAMLNRFVRRTAVGMTASYGDGIVRLVSDTVRGWDARDVTDRIESAVGRDLQYIRINGTLVGGLVGLGLHSIDVLL